MSAASIPRGGAAVMQQRREPPDSCDFFPTPPWATRALCEIVLPTLGLMPMPIHTAWEPACGEGHMSQVLAEYFGVTFASDVHDYGAGAVASFIGEGLDVADCDDRDFDWIITNPPFNLAGEFVARALRESRIGAAMLVRTSWLEGGERYREIFAKTPPIAVAQFCERVPMVKGRWDPKASTATSYAWVVWAHLVQPMPTRFIWIPPGQRQALTRPTDVERFARCKETAPA